MIEVIVYSLLSTGQVESGTITYNPKTKKIDSKANDAKFEILMTNVLDTIIGLENGEYILPSKPEHWIKNLYRQSGTYLRFGRPVST